VRKEIEIMKCVDHVNCVKLYEVIEDVPQKNEEGNDVSDDDLSEKIYLIMELARHKEVMSWNTNTYKFEPNPIFGKAFIPEQDILKVLKDCLLGL
jgi:serine/threonine protein kinase